MNLPRIALPALGAQPGQRGKEPPPGQGFDALLALHDNAQARTAPAEGPKNRKAPDRFASLRGDVKPDLDKGEGERPKISEADPSPWADKPAGPDATGKPTGDPTDVKPGDPATPVPDPQPADGGQSPSSGVNITADVPVPPVVAAPAANPAVGTNPQPADGGQSPSSGVNIPALPADGAAAAEELPVGDVPQAPVAPLPALDGGDAKAPEIPVALPVGPKADQPVAPVAPKADAPAADAAQTATASGQDGQSGDAGRQNASAPTGQPQSPVASDRPADAQSDRAGAASPAAGAAAVGQQAQPQHHATPAPGAAHAYGLRLAETVRELREVAHIARTRGAALARLELHPAELGGVAVRLKVTAEGLFAQIAADRPDAVQALQQAGAELRRSLEDRGLNIVALDVTLAAGAGAQTNDHAAQRRDDGAAEAIASTRDMDGTGSTGGMEQDAPVTTVRTPSGVLVDVLA